jgi:hypothetical protein
VVPSLNTYYVPSSGISAITVRGTAAEVAKSKDLLLTFESDPAAACRHTVGADRKALQDEMFAAQKSQGTGSASDKAPTAVKEPAEVKKP